MILKRIYVKGRSYGYRFKPEIQTYHELMEFGRNNPDIDILSLDNATYFFDELTREEQDIYWKNSIKNIMFNTRWVLDHLDSVCEYKTRWNHYGKRYGRITVGMPPSNLTKECDKVYNYYSVENQSFGISKSNISKPL